MRKSYALYRKEIKGNFSLFVIPVALMVVAILSKYLYLDILYSTKQIPKMLDMIRVMASTSSYMLIPLLFVYALSLEEKHGTIYQLHLLPVRRRTILWYKFLSAMVFVFIWALLGTINGNMSVIVVGPYVTLTSITRYPGLWVRPFFSALALNIGYISLIALAWGAAFTVRRYRQFTGVATFLLGGVCVLQFTEYVSRTLTPFLISHKILTGRYAVRDVPLTMTFIFCLGLLYIGLLLYEKYSEL